MQELFTFYSVTSGSHIAPLFVVFMILMFGLPTVNFPEVPHDSPPLKRGLRRIGITRYKQLFEIFSWRIKEYLTVFSLVAFSLQFKIVVTIFLVLYVDNYIYLLPFNFIPYIGDRWSPNVVNDLFLFWVTTGLMQWLPMICLVLALLSRIPLPLLSTLTEISKPPSDEILDGEENSEGFAWIHLTRFENTEKIIIYAYCRDDRSEEIFKAVLCQEKKAETEPQCFLFTEDGYLEQIIPAPITIDVLDEIFVPDDDEVTV